MMDSSFIDLDLRLKALAKKVANLESNQEAASQSLAEIVHHLVVANTELTRAGRIGGPSEAMVRGHLSEALDEAEKLCSLLD